MEIQAPVEIQAPAEIQAPMEAAPAPIIMLDDKPNVKFGAFDAVYHEVGEDSDMIYDPKDDDPTPVLEIMEEQGTCLSAEDFDSLDAVQGMEAGDYEEL
jgi:hypothetical protein